jgi:hypothetical protein
MRPSESQVLDICQKERFFHSKISFRKKAKVNIEAGDRKTLVCLKCYFNQYITPTFQSRTTFLFIFFSFNRVKLVLMYILTYICAYVGRYDEANPTTSEFTTFSK